MGGWVGRLIGRWVGERLGDRWVGGRHTYPVEHALAHVGFHFAVHHHDDNAPVVFPSSAGPPTHLDVFAGGDPSKVL